jgi:bifunctional non-homologous end joining protein LigD
LSSGSRYATDYSDTFLRIAEAIRALPVDHVMIDGEAVVFRPDGHSDFAALRTNRGAAEASFVAYDLLRFQGEDWRSMPLEVRRAQLESLVSGIDGLTFSESIEGDGAIVFDHACRLGLEGIVSKRLGGLYASGRCRNWLKVKNPLSRGDDRGLNVGGGCQARTSSSSASVRRGTAETLWAEPA